MGIRVTGGAPDVAGNTLAGNGYLYATQTSPSAIQLEATAATVRGNTIENTAGAGVSVTGSRESLPQATPTVLGNSIRDNIGPAIAAYAPVNVIGNEITRNQATGPAVLVNVDSEDTRPSVMNGNRITDNAAYGALWVQGRSADMQVVANTIERTNRPSAYTVYVNGHGISLVGNRIAENSAAAITVQISVSGVTRPPSQVRDNLIVQNPIRNPSSASNALAVYGYADIVGNTLADNDGGLYTREPNLVANNVFTFNRNGLRAEPDAYKRPIMRHNLAYGNASGNYLNVADPTGTDGNLSADPLFVDRAAGDYTLLSGSPAIDAGDDSVALPDERDVTGRRRVFGTHVDIGAFEYFQQNPLPMAGSARALRIAAGLDTAGVDDMAHLDADSSGAVEVSDAARLLRRAMGWE
jgi:hypothetical protein